MIYYKARPMSRKDINKDVRKIRKYCNCEYCDYFDIVSFIEKTLPLIYSDFNYEILEVEEMGDIFAETFPSQHKMRIREDVYIHASEGDGFSRFTLSHEVGHLFEHIESNISFCHNKEKVMKTHENPEWQANAFGGELLAPSYLIRGKTVIQIHKDHGITLSAAKVQKNVLKRVYDNYKGGDYFGNNKKL